MPYGISQTQPDCGGWAAVKVNPDGTHDTIGCHQTKQDAIDQMVAVSISEGMEPAGDVGARGMMMGDGEQPEGEGLPDIVETILETGLDPRNAALYEAYEDIAEQFGPWQPAEAHYMEESPFVAEGMACRNCSLYVGGGRCEVVAGDIAENALCKLWVIRKDLLTARDNPNAINYDVADMEQATEQRVTNWVVREDTGTRRVAFSNMEVRASEDGTKLVGYAAVFDSPSEPLPWIEYVRRGAFTKTLNDGADVRLLIDHEGVPLARTKSGTLRLSEDERGLLVESQLDPNNPDAARLISALRRGDISQMSFAFRTIKDNWNTERSVRELREVQLFDVSVVTFPAYEATVAELRNSEEPVIVTPVSNLNLRVRQIQIARHK